jgi:diguanylate cyclase (GGDEF)-like protein/PAS domain S-box-containing protein
VPPPADVFKVGQSAEHHGAAAAPVMAAGCDPSSDRLEQVLALLEAHPSARVLAGARDARPVAVPTELPIPRGRCLPAHALDSLDPDFIGRLIEALDASQRTGYGQAEIQFSLPDPEPVTIHIFDTCDTLEVRLCVLTVDDPASTFLDQLAEEHSTPIRLRMTQDRYGIIVDIDESLERLLGYRSGELAGQRCSDHMHPHDMAVSYGNWVELMNDPSQPRLQRLRYRTAAGKFLWLDITFTNRLIPDDVIVCACVDVTADVEAQHRVAERARLLHRLTESLPLGVVQIDAEGRVCHVNDRLAIVLGFALDADISELAAHVDPAHRGAFDDAVQTVLLGDDVDVQVLVNPGRNRPRVCQVNLRCLAGEDGGDGALICITEVTEAVRLQQELEYQATHDALSGCLNRPSILQFLTEQLKADAENANGPAAVFVDLDRFKAANDLYGHAVGDEILAAVGGRLRNLLRRGDAVGRLGGDEFLVVFRSVSSAEEAKRLSERVGAALVNEIKLAVGTLWCSGSVGVSWSDNPNISADEMVDAADGAMYTVKRASRRSPVLNRKKQQAAS